MTFPLLVALGVLLIWTALTNPPRVDVSSRLDLDGRPRGVLGRLDERLARAGVPVSAGELLTSGLVLGGIAGAFMLAVTGQFIVSLLLLLVGPVVVYLRAEGRREQAEREYQDELVHAIDVIRQSYDSRTDLYGAIRDAMNYTTGAVGEDFTQVLTMMNQGADVEQAFGPVQARRRNLFLDMVVEALRQKQHGGELRPVLASIQALLREQNRIYQRMVAHQTQARTEATLVCLAPLVFLMFVRTVFRDYEQGFYGTVTGQLVIIGAFLLDGLAYLLSRKIARSGMEITRFEVA